MFFRLCLFFVWFVLSSYLSLSWQVHFSPHFSPYLPLGQGSHLEPSEVNPNSHPENIEFHYLLKDVVLLNRCCIFKNVKIRQVFYITRIFYECTDIHQINTGQLRVRYIAQNLLLLFCLSWFFFYACTDFNNCACSTSFLNKSIRNTVASSTGN